MRDAWLVLFVVAVITMRYLKCRNANIAGDATRSPTYRQDGNKGRRKTQLFVVVATAAAAAAAVAVVEHDEYNIVRCRVG